MELQSLAQAPEARLKILERDDLKLLYSLLEKAQQVIATSQSKSPESMQRQLLESLKDCREFRNKKFEEFQAQAQE